MGANMAALAGKWLSRRGGVRREQRRRPSDRAGTQLCRGRKSEDRHRALSDVIVTVVSDDLAMKRIYVGGLLNRAKVKLFINCATVTPAIHRWVEQSAKAKGASSLEACMASSIRRHGGRFALSHVWRETGGVRARKTDLGKTWQFVALHRHGWQNRRSEGPREHGDERQHRRTRGRSRLGAALGLDLTILREVFFADRRAFRRITD